MSKRRQALFFLLGTLVVVAITVGALVTGRFNLQRKAANPLPNQVMCVSGSDPYNSNQIVVSVPTSYPNGPIEFNPYVFRCAYRPGVLQQYHGSYKCEGGNNPCPNHEPSCFVGTWDPTAVQDFTLRPGESRTLTLTVNNCEIAQLDVYNPVEHSAPDASECWNPSSQFTNPPPPNFWPGGVAFAIKENATGYNTTTQSCPSPTTPPTNTPVPPTATPTNSPLTPTVPPATPTRTPTPQPTAPPGQPTYTPIPTATPTRAITSVPTVTPIVYYPTAVPTRPVAGSAGVTILGILGGVGLILLSIL